MKKGILFTLSVATLLFVGLSCKKKCDIPEKDSISGEIIEAVIYPSTGGMIVPGGLHIHSGTNQTEKDKFQVSFDGGITVQSVDYSQYTILGYPLAVECDVAIDRSVVVDDLNQLVTFTVKVHNCNNGCTELRNIENYVIVPAFDPTYNIVYTVDQ